MSGNTPTWGALLAVLVVMAIASVLPAAAQNESEATAPPSAGGMRDPAGQNVVMIENTGFAPDPIAIQAGDTVTWMNNDTSPHAITGATPGGPGALNSDVIAPGGTFTHLFTEPGTYVYTSATTGMTGTIIVGGMSTGQTVGNVTTVDTIEGVPGGNGTPPLSPTGIPFGDVVPGMNGQGPQAPGPTGVVSLNESGNVSQGEGASGMNGNASRTGGPAGVAPPDQTGTPVGSPTGGDSVPEVTGTSGGDLPPTTPESTPLPVAGVIGALLAAVGLRAAAKRRR
ncbi:plastocyanin/azurin family copper-binding protein [Methanoculleus bourgensis]|uniref:plastocyanin/azurin family copper-binding protein n=1 Tax=Methanoculleus bourgensis TaxID=83986 RepID=UPI0022EE9784|nr:plastocyanin/azurin family copper-binding protein [Methanoculleus bourgensis]GLI46446.1 hypothetical protein MBOURGENBZM_12380 [Methanoculleus bourgensis]